jgi:hypothetical protein
VELKKNEFQVVSVSKAKPPEGEKGNWHSYTIERGTTVMTGMKPGTQKQVTEHAKQIAKDLNDRSGMKGGSPYASRNNNNKKSAS